MEPLRLYHSRTSALATTAGGCLLAGLGVGAVFTGNDAGTWTYLIGIVGALGAVMGLRQLLTSKPTIVVDDEGILIEAGMIPWDAIRATATSHSGFPIKLYLHLTLESGNVFNIKLQELNMRPGRALDEIVQRLQLSRPDLTQQPDA